MKANSGVLESPGQARSFATTFIAIRTELMDKFRKSSVLSKKGTCPKKGTGTLGTLLPSSVRGFSDIEKQVFDF
jgi:hypothetical protein